jgi:hypothetical protein
MPFHAYSSVHRLMHHYDLMLAIVDAGTLCWLAVYVLAIIQGHKYKTYGIPLASVLLNSSWEVMAAFVWVAPEPLWHVGAIVWLCFDLVIIWQLVTNGRAHQDIPEMKRFYPWVLGVGFALALATQGTFARFAADDLGFADSYLINLVMSALFLRRFFAHRQHDGLAYAVAWTKMIGTGVISVALGFNLERFFPRASQWPLMYLLFGTIFALDVLYIALLARERRGPPPSAVTVSSVPEALTARAA